MSVVYLLIIDGLGVGAQDDDDEYSDPDGYAKCLQEVDGALPSIIEKLGNDDLLLITADHGNDPCDNNTDHTREFVP